MVSPRSLVRSYEPRVVDSCQQRRVDDLRRLLELGIQRVGYAAQRQLVRRVAIFGETLERRSTPCVVRLAEFSCRHELPRRSRKEMQRSAQAVAVQRDKFRETLFGIVTRLQDVVAVARMPARSGNYAVRSDCVQEQMRNPAGQIFC